jgi:hypothetical protein
VLVLRIGGVLLAIALAVCVILWVATGQRKWLRLAWHVLRGALVVLVLVLLLMFGERLLAL